MAMITAAYVATVDGFAKIGATTNLHGRLQAMQTSIPYPLVLVHYIECVRPKLIEEELLERYADRRVRGEWFKLTDADIECIRSLAAKDFNALAMVPEQTWEERMRETWPDFDVGEDYRKSIEIDEYRRQQYNSNLDAFTNGTNGHARRKAVGAK